MARIREYEFVTGIETSTAPTPASPSGEFDSITLGYLEDQSFWGAAVTDYAAIRALVSTERKDRQTRFVETTEEDWYFDTANSGTDDGATILKPNDLGGGDPGRWLIKTAGGGGGGSGASGIEQLTQKLEAEEFNIITERLDNSAGSSGRFAEPQTFIAGYLLREHTTSDSILEVAWNAQSFDTGSPNYDSTTGWTAVSAGNTLTASNTAGEFQVGTHGLKFDKDGTATDAGIRYDRGSQNFYGAAANPRLFAYIKLPSTTQLSDVYAKIYADTTSNFRKWTKATAFGGGALATGWNLVMFDLSDTTGTSTGGTGWVYTQAARYAEFGVDTSVAGQTYTGVILDSMFFSLDDPNKIGVIGTEFSLFNNSTKEYVKVSGSETDSDGILTLSGALGATYAGGVTGSSRSYVLRSTLANTGNAFLEFDNNANYSGAVTTTQEFRSGSILRESVAKDYTAIVDVLPVQNYVVTAVGGSTIDVSDPNDQSANLLNTDTMEIFRPYYYENKVYYVLHASRALTANSSHSSGTTTLTLTTTGILVGDIVCKRHLTEVAFSCVSTPTTIDNFSALSLASAPNGVQLLEQGIDYPNRPYVFAHYLAGAYTDTFALKNQFGLAVDMTKTGSPNLQTAGPPHRLFSADSLDGSNFTTATAAGTQPLSGDANVDGTNLMQISFWLYFNGTSGSARSIMSRVNGTPFTTGWYANVEASESTIRFTANGVSIINPTYNTNALITGWNHVVLVLRDTGACHVWTNGVDSSANTVANIFGNAVQPLYFGIIGGSGGVQPATGFRLADVIFMINGPELTSAQVSQLYNAGKGIAVGSSPMIRYQFTATGQNGQKIALRSKMQRSTTAVTPRIIKMGAI